MAICTYHLTGNIENSCDVIGGMREIGFICNREDITGYTESGNAVSALTFATDKVMYKIFTPVKSAFAGSNVSLEAGDVVNRFTNTCSFVILDNSPAVAGIVDKLANGKFVVVMENEYQGLQGASSFTIMGLERGLRATEISHDPYDDASEGGWTVTLAEEKCAKSEHFFFDGTSYSSTKTTLEGYCTPASTL